MAVSEFSPQQRAAPPDADRERADALTPISGGRALHPWLYGLIADRRRMAVFAGLLTGLLAGLFGLLTVVGTPVLSLGALLGVGAGVFILSNLRRGLYATIFAVALLPFATLPVRVAVTPTFIDIALGCFLLVYLVQWMRRERTGLRLIPAHALILLFCAFMVFSFVAGMNNGLLTTMVLRKFVEMLLSILLVIVLVDVVRDSDALRRLALVIVVAGALQAVVGIGLYALPDETAERVLNTLGRFGYPAGGVIRYIEDNPALGERAIGTWVDPNAYGGFLMMVGALAGAQIVAARPITGRRWLAIVLFAPLAVAILITQSRGAWVALAVGAAFVALLRYRWLLIIGIVALAVLLTLPFMQSYVERLLDGLQGEDLATQMRFGEYKDAFILIGRYPLIGVGFTGTPDRDIYLGVSNMYLKIAGATGVVGLGLFALIVLETYRYGLCRWRLIRANPDVMNAWLGFMAGLTGALVSGVVDHFYFNIEFHGAVTMFWLFLGLALASARLAGEKVAARIPAPDHAAAGEG